MLRIALDRLLAAALVIVLTAVALFTLMHSIPGDPASAALGPRATAEMLASFRERMGLDQPLPFQFLNFASALLRGDLGVDVWSGAAVSDLVFAALPHTLLLMFATMAWSVTTGIALGLYSALRPGSWGERFLSAGTIAMIAVPPFVIAIYAMLVFSVGLRWFPATGLGTEGGILGQLHALVLPAFALGLGWVGYIARVVRASAIETIGQPHFTTAQAFAIPPSRLIWAYVLRLAITPIVLLLAASIGNLLSSAVVIEIVFARAGIGKLTYDAVLARNYPVVMGCVVVTVVVFQIAVILGDLIVAALDPRTRRR